MPLVISFSSCLKDRYDLSTDANLQWFCGENSERVVKNITAEAGGLVEITLENINLCMGANGIRTEIRQNGQLLLSDDALNFPKVLQLQVTDNGPLQIRTDLFAGPALILCSRVGKVAVKLNY